MWEEFVFSNGMHYLSLDLNLFHRDFKDFRNSCGHLQMWIRTSAPWCGWNIPLFSPFSFSTWRQHGPDSRSVIPTCVSLAKASPSLKWQQLGCGRGIFSAAEEPLPVPNQPCGRGGMGCIPLQQHCSARVAVSHGIQEILNPSHCSWPQSIILAKARSLFQRVLSRSHQSPLQTTSFSWAARHRPAALHRPVLVEMPCTKKYPTATSAD